jgi:hypothetical protein
MRSPFREVARLGSGHAGYPWILADSRNWVLRLGPSRGEDEKYFSNLPSLLEGMTAHLLRRRLGQDGVLEGIQLLIQEHREGLAAARQLGLRLAAALGRSEPRGEWPQAI